ncbi:MAG: NUDIX hydrolase [Deltaproteobacteria bacterium]|nr:NUDIX hydrolase [Deltaproteobacteria bacterium]
MKKLFCPQCGSRLEVRELEGRERLACPACNNVLYENPLPVASVLVPGPDRSILLIKRNHEPFMGRWCMPVGFAEIGEDIEQAALRELREEAGIDGRIRQLLDASSYVSPLYGDVLIVTFEAEKAGGIEQAGDDADEARYFPLDGLPPIPFPPQTRAIAAYLRLHEEEWTIRKSMEGFLASTRSGELFSEGMASDLLLDMLALDPEPAVAGWVQDVTSHSSTLGYHGWDRHELQERARYVLSRFASWLKGALPADSLRAHYVELGARRAAEGFALHEVLSSFLLLKKHIWAVFVERGYRGKLLDTYRVLELDKRVAYFFDHVLYSVTLGFESKRLRPEVDDAV